MSTSAYRPASDSTGTSPTLLGRVKQRDPAAWTILVELYGPLVYHWIRRSGLDEHDAADLLQDVYAAVARSIDRFEARDRGAFRAWLWRVTRNRINDHFRRQMRRTRGVGGSDAWQRMLDVSQSLSDDPDEFTDPAQLTGLHHRGLELVRGEFEQRTWQMFLRVAVEDQSAADVAAEFGVTANAVRQIKSRVLRRLRQVLGDQSGQ